MTGTALRIEVSDMHGVYTSRKDGRHARGGVQERTALLCAEILEYPPFSSMKPAGIDLFNTFCTFLRFCNFLLLSADFFEYPAGNRTDETDQNGQN